MFGQAKPMASLSSGLLARKGQARPAMRSQALGGFSMGQGLEDLGWNDMGGAETATAPAPAPEPAPAPVAAPVPAPAAVVTPVDETVAVAIEADVPNVLVEREALAARLDPPAATRSVSLATAARVQRESAQQTRKGKAAFTLRLDGERHLRLRLASAVTNRSAQDLVTMAVDALLGSLPAVETLVAQLPAAKPARKR